MRKKQNIRTDKKCDETDKNSKSPSLKGKTNKHDFPTNGFIVQNPADTS